MRRLADVFVLGLLAACTTAPAVNFSGRYAGNEAASVMNGAHVPPEFVYLIEDDGATLHLLQTFTRADGKPARNEWRGVADGERRMAIGDPPHALAVTRTPLGELIIRGYSADGAPQGEEICALHKDGGGFTCRNLPGGAAKPFSYVFDRIG
jgi:hypothetical protein